MSSTDNEVIVESVPEALLAALDAAEPPVVPEMTSDLYVFANNPNEHMYEVLKMFYIGVVENTVAVAQVLDVRTNTERLVLVGIASKPGETPKLVPLAFVMNEEDAAFIKTPDGKGNYVGTANVAIKKL